VTEQYWTDCVTEFGLAHCDSWVDLNCYWTVLDWLCNRIWNCTLWTVCVDLTVTEQYWTDCVTEFGLVHCELFVWI